MVGGIADMGTVEIKIAQENGISRIILNRPQKRNALTRELLRELRGELQRLAKSESLRALCISATGPVFCAGMDLGQMQRTAADPKATEFFQADAQAYRDVLGELFQLPVPTIAMVQGPAMAGGFGLVLACDIVIASEAATFFLPEPQRGITAAIVTPLLIYRLGAANASYLLLSGRQIDAETGFTRGLCHQVVAPELLDRAAEETLESIMAGSPQALAASKKFLQECAGPQILAQLDSAVALSARARETTDAREGLQAFLEHRTPSWQAR